MGTYIIRRLIQAVIVIIIVTVAIFLLLHLMPGDPIYMLYSTNAVAKFTPEQLQAIKHEAGLDRPLVIQYFRWVNDLLHGDLGTSVIYRDVQVSDAVKQRLPRSVYLGVLAFIVGFFFGIPMGIISAVKRNTWLDTVVTSFANLGITIPVFWLGVMLIYVFGVRWHLLPVMGFTSPFDDFWKSCKQLIMPVICLAIFPVAGTARQTRSIMLEVLKQDYIRTAWSKGLKQNIIIVKHALKNCFIPILTLQGLFIAAIVGGEVLIESVFSIPGMGRLAVDSLLALDYAYVQAVVLIVAIVVVLSNLLIDISYGWFDPRIRYT
jgi:peptide/nickel transport system permease protein